jgi:hypothetical protein
MYSARMSPGAATDGDQWRIGGSVFCKSFTLHVLAVFALVCTLSCRLAVARGSTVGV